MFREYFNRTAIVFLISIILLIAVNSNLDLWKLRRNFEPIKYQAEIDKYAAEFSLEPELLAAIIYVESRFDNYSKSHKGAIGLMQLMPSTAFWVAKKLEIDNFTLEDLNNPEINIRFGSWYFSYLYQKFDKDLIKAIAAYNAGESNVYKWINEGWNGDLKSDELPYSETDSFVRRVISTKDFYKKRAFKSFKLTNSSILLSDSYN